MRAATKTKPKVQKKRNIEQRRLPPGRPKPMIKLTPEPVPARFGLSLPISPKRDLVPSANVAVDRSCSKFVS